MIQVLSFGQAYYVAQTVEEARTIVDAAPTLDDFVEFTAMDESIYPFAPSTTDVLQLRAGQVHGLRDFSQVA